MCKNFYKISIKIKMLSLFSIINKHRKHEFFSRVIAVIAFVSLVSKLFVCVAIVSTGVAMCFSSPTDIVTAVGEKLGEFTYP